MQWNCYKYINLIHTAFCNIAWRDSMKRPHNEVDNQNSSFVKYIWSYIYFLCDWLAMNIAMNKIDI